jgi:hypothetical protein
VQSRPVRFATSSPQFSISVLRTGKRNQNEKTSLSSDSRSRSCCATTRVALSGQVFFITMRSRKSMASPLAGDKISIDFVREGTGKLIFRRQYPRELVERVCKERGLTEGEWVTGDAGQSSEFTGMGKHARDHSRVHKQRRCGPADPDSRYGMAGLCSLRGAKKSGPGKPLSRSRWPGDSERHHRRRDGKVALPLRKARQRPRGSRQRNCTRGFPHEKELEETAKRLRTIRWLLRLSSWPSQSHRIAYSWRSE